jgi:hypothetical protein
MSSASSGIIAASASWCASACTKMRCTCGRLGAYVTSCWARTHWVARGVRRISTSGTQHASATSVPVNAPTAMSSRPNTDPTTTAIAYRYATIAMFPTRHVQRFGRRGAEATTERPCATASACSFQTARTRVGSRR